MRVRVLYFARLRDEKGVGDESLELPEGSRIQDLLPIALANSAWSLEMADYLSVAKNRTIVGRDVELKDGDEVALLPPVSGG